MRLLIHITHLPKYVYRNDGCININKYLVDVVAHGLEEQGEGLEGEERQHHVVDRVHLFWGDVVCV